MKAYISEMRIKSWLKNVFVFIPLVFALELLNIDKLLPVFIAFAAFCLTSSGVYVLNDIFDIEKDRMHPVKRSRPVASGIISKRKAAVFAALLVIAGLGASVAVNIPTIILTASYFIINLAYSLRLKHMPVIDCFCIAAGFVLRIYGGSAASGEPVSDWLFLTIVAMSLFMAFGKRRGELTKVGGSATREVLRQYSLSFLEGMVFSCAGLSVMFYALWAMNRGNYMIYTVPLIIFAIARYLLLVHKDSHGDPTSVIFGDKILLCVCGSYGLITVGLLYLGRYV